MKIIFHIFKKILLIVFFFILTFILYNIILYIWTPYYKFSDYQAFKGNTWYNPYENIDSNCWLKVNFHAHSKAWCGLTDGRNSIKDSVFKKYRELGFSFASISNYQKIEENLFDTNYIKCYEHGFNLNKTHFLCINSKKVSWLDYFFGLTLNAKQYVIDNLKENNDYVALAHPSFRNAFNVEDLKYLSNYDFIEVVNGYRISENHWDTALSNGFYVPLIAGDDAHNVFNIKEIGRRFTLVNCKYFNKDSLLIKLKIGTSIAVNIPEENLISDSIKLSYHKNLPYLKHCKITNDTLFLEFNRKFANLKIISQNGKIVDSILNKQSIIYPLRRINSYLRLKVTFDDDVTFWLNPIVKTVNCSYPTKKVNEIDRGKTLATRIMFFLIGMIFVGGILFYIYKKG